MNDVAQPSRSAAPVRDEHWDVLKGLLILLVVWGHLIQYQSYGLGPHVDGQGYFEDPVFKWIYMFHMPLFMAVAGFLFAKGLQRDTSWSRVPRLVGRLLVPAVAWFVLFNLAMFAGRTLGGGWSEASRFVSLGRFWLELLYHAWFVWCVLIFDILFICLCRFRLDRRWLVLVLVLGSFWLPDVSVMFLFQFTFPYYCLGYLLAATSFPEFSKKLNPYLWGFGLIAIPAYRNWTTLDYVYLYSWSIPIAGWLDLASKHLSVCSMLVLMYMIYRSWGRYAHGGVVARIGRQSLLIYLIQGFVMAGVPALNLPFHGTLGFSFSTAPVIALVLSVGLSLFGEYLPRLPGFGPFLLGRFSMKRGSPKTVET